MSIGTFEGPRKVGFWTNEEKLIATKNLLQDKTCDHCSHNLYCNLSHNKYNTYNTCYKYKENHNILKVVRLGYPNTIINELVSVQPIEVSNSVFYLKYDKNTRLRRTFNKLKSIFNKKNEERILEKWMK